jgi:putative hemolysin
MYNGLLLILLPILLLLAFMFTAAEVAFFSLPRNKVGKWRDEPDETSRRLAKLLDHPRELLLTTVFGYTGAVALFVTVVILATRQVFAQAGLERLIGYLIGLLIATPFIVLFGSLLPRFTAMADPEKTARILSQPVIICYRLFAPATTAFGLLSGGLARMFGIERERQSISASQLDALIEVEEQHEEINAAEREMIEAVFEIRDKPAREIMVPRIDLVAISIDTPLSEVKRVVSKSIHSRIPVFDGTIDNIVGVLYVKDLLKEIPTDATLRHILREPYFVPDNKHINELLREFQKKRLHLAIVVDEYGGVAGVVTLEDILEVIIGDIQDEYDHETPSVTKLNDHEWQVEGRLPVEELNEYFGEEIVPESEDYDTVGGYLNSLAGRVPDTGDTFQQAEWRYIVEKRAENRVQSVRMIRNPVEQES